MNEKYLNPFFLVLFACIPMMTDAQIYKGVIPCSDCDGIETIIHLQKDKKRFDMQERFIGKSQEPIRTDGTYKVINGVYVFYAGSTVKGAFKLSDGEMMMLDRQRKPIEGTLAEKYKLKRTMLVTSNIAWERKQKKGIDFTAFGNEPFWSLDIDAETTIRFQTADLTLDFETPYKDFTMEQKNMHYTMKNNASWLSIEISKQYCSDGMSHFLYPYQIKMNLNGQSFTGCGAMLGSLPKPGTPPKK